MRTKRTLAMALSAVMTLSLCFTLLPKTAFAAAYNVRIGSADLSGKTGVVYLDASYSEVAQGNALLEYDPTGTVPRITVIGNGANTIQIPENTPFNSIIAATGTGLELVLGGQGLTLDLIGIRASEVYGIYMPDGTLSITGDKPLTITQIQTGLRPLSKAQATSAGIYAQSISIGSGCTVTVGECESGKNAYGVYANGTLSVSAGGSLTATGGSVIGNSGDPCVSYGVYSTGNMTVNGTLTGNGGVVELGSGNAYAAKSTGVYAGGALTADGGAVTGNGGAVTSEGNDAISTGVYIGGAGSVTGNTGRMTGTGGSTSNMIAGYAQSVGVDCVGSLTAGSGSAAQTAALTGTGGSAIALATAGTAGSVGVRTQAPITVNDGAALTGAGGLARANDIIISSGVITNGQSITVRGTLNGTGGTGLTGGTSNGVTVSSGSVNLFGNGSMTAIANGTGTSTSFGVEAGDGITMADDSHLTAQVEAAPDSSHAAKTLRDEVNQNALNTASSAVWRGSNSGAFASISTYNANRNEQDKQPHQYLEVKNGGNGLVAAPAGLDFDTSTTGGNLPAAQTITITNKGEGDIILSTPQPTLTDYMVSFPDGYSFDANKKMRVTVQPKPATMNTAKNYDATLTISGNALGSGSARVEIPLTFTVNAAPSVTLEANPLIVNSGGQVTLTAVARYGTGTYTSYEWSNGTNTWSTTTSTTTVNPTARTSYTVRVKDSSGVWSAVSGAKRVDIAGALSITMLPHTAYPQGMCGGDYEVTIGMGTPPTDLGARNLAFVTVSHADGTDYSPTENTDYSVRDGSIIITLDEDYLNDLPVGVYTLTAGIDGGLYDGQTPSRRFQVTEPGSAVPNIPRTGDGAQPLLWLSLMGLAGAGLFVLGKRRKAHR